FLGLLIITEGAVAYRSAHVRTSPALVVSSRGLPIGQQLANRVWLLPLFLLVPGNGLESHLSWWPVFTVPGGSFHFLWIPYFVGFGQRVQG
ncbi:cell division protein, partial [Xanthomonas citri pv. citri]|nr:cell division protein [Xanthomonas citri pv. citri]